MKYGYFIGLDRKNNVLKANGKEIDLDDFMVDKNIMNTQDIFLFPDTVNEEYRIKFVKTLQKDTLYQ